MESKLSLSEFRRRLENNTEIGSLKVNLSLFRICLLYTSDAADE